ncbi:carboxymuconolactone decarboxylase family protein [Rhodocaloribacter sp.]|jgi:AhpD family alkylhydroperoxidase
MGTQTHEPETPAKHAWQMGSGMLPGLIHDLDRLRAEAMGDRALDKKVKELIALGIAVAERSETSIAYHVHNALAAGVSREEIAETIGVAIFVGTEPAAIQGIQLLEALARDEVEKYAEGVFRQAAHPYMSPD